MARAKSKSGATKFATLPEGVRKLPSQLTWDPETKPLLTGTIAGFGESPAKNFNDGNWFPGKKQRFVKIRPDDTDDDVVYVVYEGGGLSALFDHGEGEQVAIAFTGTKVVEGRKNPQRIFEVGVY